MGWGEGVEEKPNIRQRESSLNHSILSGIDENGTRRKAVGGVWSRVGSETQTLSELLAMAPSPAPSTTLKKSQQCSMQVATPQSNLLTEN